MKKGDKLICKKKIHFTDPEHIMNVCDVYDIIGITNSLVELKYKNINSSIIHFRLKLNKDGYDGYDWLMYIWDYFYTKDEIRLKKLESFS
ncbi:hypothetical protein M0Q50_09625 [bacterium]|jgi:hypothetical protein|nr:hypothetical protein [bacterium]